MKILLKALLVLLVVTGASVGSLSASSTDWSGFPDVVRNQCDAVLTKIGKILPSNRTLVPELRSYYRVSRLKKPRQKTYVVQATLDYKKGKQTKHFGDAEVRASSKGHIKRVSLYALQKPLAWKDYARQSALNSHSKLRGLVGPQVVKSVEAFVTGADIKDVYEYRVKIRGKQVRRPDNGPNTRRQVQVREFTYRVLIPNGGSEAIFENGELSPSRIDVKLHKNLLLETMPVRTISLE